MTDIVQLLLQHMTSKNLLFLFIYGKTNIKTSMIYLLCAFLIRQMLDAVSRISLVDMKEDALNYSVIGIDEGQFVSNCYRILSDF